MKRGPLWARGPINLEMPTARDSGSSQSLSGEQAPLSPATPPAHAHSSPPPSAKMGNLSVDDQTTAALWVEAANQEFAHSVAPLNTQALHDALERTESHLMANSQCLRNSQQMEDYIAARRERFRMRRLSGCLQWERWQWHQSSQGTTLSFG